MPGWRGGIWSNESGTLVQSGEQMPTIFTYKIGKSRIFRFRLSFLFFFFFFFFPLLLYVEYDHHYLFYF